MTNHISAGDLEKYTYCPVDWMLSKSNKVDLSKGVEKHRIIAKKGLLQQTLKKQLLKLELVILTFSTIATVFALFGLTFFMKALTFFCIVFIITTIWGIVAVIEVLVSFFAKYKQRVMLILEAAFIPLILSIVLYFFFPDNTLMGLSFEIVAIAWLMGASMAFYYSLIKEQKLKFLKASLSLPGEIIYIDNLENSVPVLVSDIYGISGRPDFIVVENNYYIPIEVKTGRVPRGPLFSHIVQIIAYCMLVEEHYHKVPPYGRIQYGTTHFDVDYTQELKMVVIKKIAQIHQAMRTGIVHRDHNNPGKCRGCSRRKYCTERIDGIRLKAR